jgi:tetratricopeptide (TPR) repeat protein
MVAPRSTTPTKASAQSDEDVRQTSNDSCKLDTIYFFVIFSFALTLRVIYLLQIESIPLFYDLAGDARTYDEWAQQIAAGEWLGAGVFYQAPLYPYFLGFLQALVGHNLWVIRLIQITIGSLSCALLFLAGRALFSRPIGLAAGLILAFYAPAVFYEALIEKSILDLVLVTIVLLLLSRCRREQRWVNMLATGIALGLLGLSRENALILAPVLTLWLGVYFFDRPMKLRVQWISLFFIGMLVVLLPVGLRNLAVGGEFKLTTSQFGGNFFIGNNPSADGTYNSVRNQIRAPQFEGSDALRLAENALRRPLTPGEVSNYWFEQSRNYIQSNPAQWLRLLGKKWLLFWNVREIEDSDDFYLYQKWSWLLTVLACFSHFGVLAPFAAAGILLTLKDWRRLWLLHAMIISLAIGVSLFYVFGRYRLPVVPLLALFAGAGMVSSMVSYKQRNWQSLMVACLGLAATAVIVNWPMHSSDGPGPAGYNNLANAYYKQGKVKEAIETAQQLIHIAPAYGVAYYNLGNFYSSQGEFELARASYEQAVKLYPNFAAARSNLGFLLVQKGEVNTGIQQLRKAIEIDHAMNKAHLNLGAALIQQGRFDEAVSALERALQLDPKSDKNHFYLGSAYASRERYDDAIKHLTEALRLNPNFPEAHQHLARTLALQGKKTEALEHLEHALRLMKQSGSRGFH